MLTRTSASSLPLVHSKALPVTLLSILTPKLSYLVRPFSIHSPSITISALNFPNLFQMTLASAPLSSLQLLYAKASNICGPNPKEALTAFHPSSLKSVHFGYVSLCPIFLSHVSMLALCRLNGHMLSLPPSVRRATQPTPSITGLLH